MDSPLSYSMSKLFETVFLFKFVNSAALFYHQTFAACVVRMAFGTNFDFDGVLGGACGEFVAASASNFHFFVFRMDTLFHIRFTSFFDRDYSQQASLLQLCILVTKLVYHI